MYCSKIHHNSVWERCGMTIETCWNGPGGSYVSVLFSEKETRGILQAKCDYITENAGFLFYLTMVVAFEFTRTNTKHVRNYFSSAGSLYDISFFYLHFRNNKVLGLSVACCACFRCHSLCHGVFSVRLRGKRSLPRWKICAIVKVLTIRIKQWNRYLSIISMICMVHLITSRQKTYPDISFVLVISLIALRNRILRLVQSSHWK